MADKLWGYFKRKVIDKPARHWWEQSKFHYEFDKVEILAKTKIVERYGGSVWQMYLVKNKKGEKFEADNRELVFPIQIPQEKQLKRKNSNSRIKGGDNK